MSDAKMAESVFVRVSEPIPTVVETETGSMVVRGAHALAGVRLTRDATSSLQLHREMPPDVDYAGAWVQRHARFWAMLAAGMSATAPSTPLRGSSRVASYVDPWTRSFELRLVGGGSRRESVEFGLWVKAFDIDAEAAAMEATALARLVTALWLPECEPRPMCSEADFERGWQTKDLPWLAEVRRDEGFAVRIAEGDVREGDYWLSDWSPAPEGLMEVWDLLRRLPAETWVSVGVRPTRLLEFEERALGELWAQAQRLATGKTVSYHPHGEWQASRWAERLKRWMPGAFLVRLRIGGEPEAGRWIAQALAGALMEPTGSPGSSAVVVAAESEEEQAVARFNWEWADFQAWGDDQAQPGWDRLRYLCDAREIGLLAGVWS